MGKKPKMKCFKCFLLIFLCGYILSCESPLQTDQTAVNKPPVVTIVGNVSTLEPLDTLRLILHASDSTLTNGTIDFKDGTVIPFNNLAPIFDSTLIHIFYSSGSYDVIVSFSDGNKITTKHFNVTVIPNSPPQVTLVTNKTTLNLGDTLIVTLHATDHTLSYGYLYFNDGTQVSVSHLNQVFDTTIIHVYSQCGDYLISAEFYDGLYYGGSPYYAHVSVVVSHYYELSLSVGITWRFSYSYDDYYYGPMIYTHQRGKHEWRIISSDKINSDSTVFTVQQIRSDSAYIDYMNGTTFINDTSQFMIASSHNSIQFNAPLNGQPFIIPNHRYVSYYPIKILVKHYPEEEYMLFEDITGPTKYYRENHPYKQDTYENLVLLEFIKP
jgi:hypothetical protein